MTRYHSDKGRRPLTWDERRDQILATTGSGWDYDAWNHERDRRVTRRIEEVNEFLRVQLLLSHRPLAGRALRLADVLRFANRAAVHPVEMWRPFAAADYERLDRKPPATPTWPNGGPPGASARERLGTVLETLRRFTGASLETVGREIGRTFSHVRNVERARFDVAVADIVLMSDAYCVCVSTVLFLSEIDG